MKRVLEHIHKESAENYLTGITKDGEVDLVAAKDGAVVKVIFEKLKPYYVTGHKRKIVMERAEIAQDYMNKGRAVRYVENEYKVKFEWENSLYDGKYYWENDVKKLELSEEVRNLIKEKLNRLNTEIRTEKRIYSTQAA